jgi:TrmH family RNA methyltransferase
VLFVDSVDPWLPAVVRASAGLHWAVPVATATWPLATERAVIAFDPGGEDWAPTLTPLRSALVFGGERHGLGDAVLTGAAKVVRLPMRAGVSSLNLATSVSAVLYGLALTDGRRAEAVQRPPA